MNIVLEGPDGGGKSTLAGRIAEATSMRVQQGSGPPREPGEIERRLAEYLAMDNVIFDRHPAVSQPIYGALRGESASVQFTGLVVDFYRSQPLIVYCRSSTPDRHVVKLGENPAHVEVLTRRYQDLVTAYDQWAAKRAHLIHRIGDDCLDIVAVVLRLWTFSQ